MALGDECGENGDGGGELRDRNHSARGTSRWEYNGKMRGRGMMVVIGGDWYRLWFLLWEKEIRLSLVVDQNSQKQLQWRVM